MSSLRERLATCFSAVFPGLGPDEAPMATIDTVAAWDSSHHFMLMQVIEETIGEIDSFAGFERYLAREGKQL
jgi:hypothetical protein